MVTENIWQVYSTVVFVFLTLVSKRIIQKKPNTKHAMSSSWLKKRFNHLRRLGGFGKKQSKAAAAADDCAQQKLDRTGSTDDDNGCGNSEVATRLAVTSELPVAEAEKKGAQVEELLESHYSKDNRETIEYQVDDAIVQPDRWAAEPKDVPNQTKVRPAPKFTSKLRQPLRDHSESR